MHPSLRGSFAIAEPASVFYFHISLGRWLTYLSFACAPMANSGTSPAPTLDGTLRLSPVDRAISSSEERSALRRCGWERR